MADAEEKTKQIPTDSAVATLTTVEGQPVRRDYVVKSKNGLFKNGKHYKQDSVVKLDEQTASGFIALGEVEEK